MKLCDKDLNAETVRDAVSSVVDERDVEATSWDVECDNDHVAVNDSVGLSVSWDVAESLLDGVGDGVGEDDKVGCDSDFDLDSDGDGVLVSDAELDGRKDMLRVADCGSEKDVERDPTSLVEAVVEADEDAVCVHVARGGQAAALQSSTTK